MAETVNISGDNGQYILEGEKLTAYGDRLVINGDEVSMSGQIKIQQAEWVAGAHTIKVET